MSYNPNEFEIELTIKHYPDPTYRSVFDEPEPTHVYRLTKTISDLQLPKVLSQVQSEAPEIMEKFILDNCEHDFSDGECELCGKLDPREPDDFEEYDRMDLDEQLKVRKMRD